MTILTMVTWQECTTNDNNDTDNNYNDDNNNDDNDNNNNDDNDKDNNGDLARVHHCLATAA